MAHASPEAARASPQGESASLRKSEEQLAGDSADAQESLWRPSEEMEAREQRRRDVNRMPSKPHVQKAVKGTIANVRAYAQADGKEVNGHTVDAAIDTFDEGEFIEARNRWEARQEARRMQQAQALAGCRGEVQDSSTITSSSSAVREDVSLVERIHRLLKHIM